LTSSTDRMPPRIPSSVTALPAPAAPDKFLKAHSAALHITHRGTLAQHRAWFYLVRNAVHDFNDPAITKHTLPLTQLAVLLDQEDPNYGFLKKTVSGLTNLNISWDIFDKTGEPEWGVASMLAGCKISKGVIEYDFSTFLREKLSNPKMYALLNLAILNQFRSKYALAIYELCKDYEGVGQTPVIPLAKYREFQGLEENEYKEFKRLNTRVIKEPVEEVNKVSDILVAVEYKKNKKTVVGIKFYVKRNPQSKIDIQNLMHSPAPDAYMKSAEHQNTTLPQRLMSYGLSAAQAKILVAKHDENYITENLAVVDKDRNKGTLKNVVAYVMAAMRDDYRPKTKTNVPTGTKPQQKKIDELREEFESLVAQEHINGLTRSARRALENEFLESVQEDQVAKRFLKDGGLDHPVMKERFERFARAKIRGRVEFDNRDFARFLKTKGISHAGQAGGKSTRAPLPKTRRPAPEKYRA